MIEIIKKPYKPVSRKRRVLAFIVAVLVTGLLIRIWILDSFIVKGDSMAPTIVEGDYIFVNKAAYWRKTPERHDLVVGEFRDVEGVLAIKRVVGLPGEWI